MASNENKRLKPSVIDSDCAALLAIEEMPDYAPINRAYAASVLVELRTAMEQAKAAEIRAQQALARARDAATAAEWALHNAILGAKTQVIAQYGNDSREKQSIGLKKKSEHKRPARQKVTS